MRISRRTKASGAENRTFAGFRRRPPAVAAFQRSEHRSDTLLNDAAASLSQSPFAFSQSLRIILQLWIHFITGETVQLTQRPAIHWLRRSQLSTRRSHDHRRRVEIPCQGRVCSTPVSQLHPPLSSVSAQMYETLWSELSSRFEYSKGVCLLICTPNGLLLLPSMHS